MQNAHRCLFSQRLQDHVGINAKRKDGLVEIGWEDFTLLAVECCSNHHRIIRVDWSNTLAPLDTQLEVFSELNFCKHHGDHHLASRLIKVMHNVGQTILNLRRRQNQQRVLTRIRHHAALANQCADLGGRISGTTTRLPRELNAAA